MLKGNILVHLCVTLALALLSVPCAQAQVDSLVHVGDSLHKVYRFDDASDAFYTALDQLQDTAFVMDSVDKAAVIESISERLRLSENGSNMSRFVRRPKVLGQRMLPLDEAVLYYPLEDKSWRTLPNQFDADTSDAFVRSLYAPDWNDVHYFSAKDDSGVRSIFVTELQDTVWTLPRRVDEVSSEVANEIYPMLSPDGKTLYFSSDGLYGLGGYDLYYSTWDDEKGGWSMPLNMGMPFSSPADDFLYVDSEDERHSMFASNRNCPKDSVWVYAIEYERYPVHASVEDPDQLLEISYLAPSCRKADVERKEVSSDDPTSVYMSKMDGVRALKDSISVISSHLEDLRTDFTFSDDDVKRDELMMQILDLEKVIPELQRQLEAAKVELQKTEYEFLKKGVIINNTEENGGESDDEEQVAEYEFVRNSYGAPLQLNIEVPQVKFDYSFRILDEAVYAEDQNLPSGIIYQIQLFGGSRKASLPELKGLSPVYEHRSPSGMYIYRVGRFSTYDEALSNILQVRNLGFRSAYLCAFDNGNEITVATARTRQERLKGGFELYEIRMVPDSGELDHRVVEFIMSTAVGKDIIRSEAEDGTQVFTVGPFDSKDAADTLVEAVQGMLAGKVTCEPIMN